MGRTSRKKRCRSTKSRPSGGRRCLSRIKLDLSLMAVDLRAFPEWWCRRGRPEWLRSEPPARPRRAAPAARGGLRRRAAPAPARPRSERPWRRDRRALRQPQPTWRVAGRVRRSRWLAPCAGYREAARARRDRLDAHAQRVRRGVEEGDGAKAGGILDAFAASRLAHLDEGQGSAPRSYPARACRRRSPGPGVRRSRRLRPGHIARPGCAGRGVRRGGRGPCGPARSSTAIASARPGRRAAWSYRWPWRAARRRCAPPRGRSPR